jgi:predicted nucleotidyltransferase component of viral defense system
MKTPEELLTRVMNHLAETFRDKLVLKGGMLLRLYNSPRFTRDVDFVFLSTESKKNLKKELIEAIERIPEIKIVKTDVHSRGIFIDVADQENKQKGLIEVNVAPRTHLPPEPLSTASLSQKFALSGRVISAMAIPEAFSHKIAATLERDTIRDIYDLSQFEAMATFDPGTLKDRLSLLSVQRSKPRAVDFRDAARMLRKRLETLDQKRIETELFPILPAEHRPGILRIIQASVGRILQRLEALQDSD